MQFQEQFWAILPLSERDPRQQPVYNSTTEQWKIASQPTPITSGKWYHNVELDRHFPADYLIVEKSPLLNFGLESEMW